jgi:hypothetical protein
MIHIDPETLKRSPWLGVAIGGAMVLLMAVIGHEMYEDWRSIPERAPIRISVSDLAGLDRSRPHWVELVDAAPDCDLAMIEERDIPERWFQDRISSTVIPLAGVPVVARFEGLPHCNESSMRQPGILCEEGSGVWGSAIPRELKGVDPAGRPRVLMVGFTPKTALENLALVGGLGVIALVFALYYLRLWRRQRPVPSSRPVERTQISPQ